MQQLIDIMLKKNAAIIVLCGRKRLLEKSLKYFYKNWNNKYDYPLYIHSFQKLFTDKEKTNIRTNFSKNIFFYEINPQIPKYIQENELFYNRKYNKYVLKNFSDKRLGYLHMCYFASNITSFGRPGCLAKELKKYDFLMRFDDDSLLKKKINYDFFNKFTKFPLATGRLIVSNKKDYILVRENLLIFLKNFFKKNKIKIKNKLLRDAVVKNNENMMLKIPYSIGNFDFYNMKKIKKSLFNKYIKAVNLFGGQYKYRWADIEIINLFFYAFYQKPIFSFRLSKEVYDDKVKEANPVYYSPFSQKYGVDLNSAYNFYLRLKKFFMKIY